MRRRVGGFEFGLWLGLKTSGLVEDSGDWSSLATVTNIEGREKQ